MIGHSCPNMLASAQLPSSWYVCLVIARARSRYEVLGEIALRMHGMAKLTFPHPRL